MQPIHMIQNARRISFVIALITAWAATLGSLYFSEILHFVPCTLCWYQRILMYPLAIILLVGVIRRDQGIAFYVLPFSILGVLTSSYHYLHQKTDLFSNSTACTSGVPCTATWINWFGIITIPFLALLAFVIITLMMILFLSKEQEEAEAIETANSGKIPTEVIR